MHGPVFRHETITPSDEDVLPQYTCIVNVSGGTMVVEDRVGVQITYPNMPAYTTFENFMPAKVLATGTNASQIVGWRLEE
jgi:hypothetical protein